MGGAGDSSELDPVEIHRILGNERRQRVLQHLFEADGELPVRELSERIAEDETGESPPPSNIRQSVYVSLHQGHLPKLDEHGILHYESTGDDVTLTERAQQVRAYMDVVPEPDLSWSEYAITVSLLGLLLIIAAEIGVPVLADIGSLVLATVTFGLLLAMAVYQRATQGMGRVTHRSE